MVVLANNELDRVGRESINTEFHKLHMYKHRGTEKNQQRLAYTRDYQNTKNSLNLKRSTTPRTLSSTINSAEVRVHFYTAVRKVAISAPELSGKYVERG